MQKLHINILFLLIWSFSFSQQYTNYTTKDGLPSNHVYRITQDKQGFIWFITDKGIVKYNGTTFKTFTTKEGLPTNDIWDFRITDDNKFWFFTKAAKMGYIEKDSIYSFESSRKGEILFPIAINQNKNRIQFTNNLNFYELKDNKWESKKVTFDDGETEPVLHANIKYLKQNSAKNSTLIINKNLKAIKILPNFRKSIIYRAQLNDSTYCWANNKNYYILNLNTLKLFSKSYKNQLKFDKTKFVRFNKVNNQIQFSGLGFTSVLDKNFNLTNTTYIPKNIKSHFSFIDKNNNLWIATFNKGVYFIANAKRESITQLNNEKVGKITWINNKLIANVYDKGFYKYNENTKSFKPFIKEKNFMYNAVFIDSIYTEYYLTNYKIISNKNGIKRNLKTVFKYRVNDEARDLVYWQKYLYGYGSAGLFKFNKNFDTIKQYRQNGIRDLEVINDNILIATSNGLKIFKNSKLENVFKESIFNYPISFLKKFNTEQAILCTDGFGAYITNLNKIELLEQSDFLNVQAAFVKDNDIWLATNKGAWHYKKKDNKIELIQKHTVNNGLGSNHINGIYVTNDAVFTSSNDGISITPINQKEKNQFINIYVDNLIYNNKILIDDKTTYTTNNHLQIKVASIDFSENKNFIYKYQLLPIQKKWITTTSNQISFNDLPPNNYQLNIKSNGKENSLKFKILPLWYQTLVANVLFWLIGLVSFIGIILGFRKKELVKQTKKLNAQKKLADFELHALRSQMNPHFVFNSLNAIQYFITKNEIDLSEKYLVKFARLIRMFFDFSREKEINLKDEINLLNGYLEIEKMRFGKDFNYKIDVINDFTVDRFKIPAMLLQPIVENAVNHGLFQNKGKGLIQIYFTFITKNSIKISINDNGVGIEKSKEIQKNSLKSKLNKNKSTNVIKERIDLLNQTKKWIVTYKTTSNNNGTSVNLTFTKNEYSQSDIN